MGTKTPSSPEARAAIGVKSLVAFSAMKTMDPDSDRVRAARAEELHSGTGLMHKN